MIDIYKLGGNEGKGSIRAVLNPKLKEKIKESIKKLKKYGFFKDFCKNTKTNYSTLWKYLNKTNYIPLYILKELEELSNIKFQQHVKDLEYGTGATKRKTKAVQSLSEEFAAIIGAFIADGHLKERITLWNKRKATHYELVFREEYKTNMLALAKWLNKIFEINIKPKKEENHYSIYISNKIIFRYFTNIFGFKSGRKTETVEIPEIFYKSSDKIKKAVAKGILMFDGSVSRKTGYVELYSKSRNLIIGISKLMKELNVNPGYISLNPDKYHRYRIIIRKKEELNKSLEFFEPETEKHIRLRKILKTFKR